MASALQGAIASAQLTTDAMAGLASMVTSTLNRATQERQLQSNIMEGIVRSAQNAKQMEIDSFFKEKELELRGEQLAIESAYKNAQLGIDNSRLRIYERQADIDERKVAYFENKQIEADKYKPYIAGLTNEANRLNDEITQKSKAYKAEEETLKLQLYGRAKSGDSPEIRGMTRFQRIQDEKNPNGKAARLKELQTKLYKDLDDKEVRRTQIEGEIRNVTVGGTPGAILPLPKGFSFNKSDSSFDVNKNTSSRDGIDPSLFPSGISDDEKAKRVLEMEELNNLERLEGALPQDNFPDAITPEQEAKEIAKQDQEYISYIFDPETRLDEVQEFQQNLSPAGKIQLAKAQDNYAMAILRDYGMSKHFDPSKDYKNEDKAVEPLTERFVRAGGSLLEANALKFEAEQKLIDLRVIASSPTIAGDDTSVMDEVKANAFVAAEYSKWISSKFTEKQKAAELDISSGIKTGSIISSNGLLPGVRSIASTETKDESLDDLLKKYTVSSEARKSKEKESKDAELYDQFSRGFIKTEGGFDRRTFADTALQQPALMYAVLGNERIDLGSSEIGYSYQEVEDNTNANRKKLIEKIKTLQAPDAFRMWKEASKFIK